MNISQLKQNTLNKSLTYVRIWTIALIAVLFASSSYAQPPGYLELLGNVQQDGKGLEGAEIKVMKGLETADNLLSSAGGKFIFNLDLGHLYTIVFSKNGTITKSVLVDTKVPESYETQIFSFKFKIDLFKAPDGVEQPKEAAPPVTNLGYSDAYEDFDYDPEYSKSRKVEMDVVKQKMASEVVKQEALRAKAEEKARQDSLAQAKKDELAADKARRDSLDKVKEQQRNRGAYVKSCSEQFLV